MNQNIGHLDQVDPTDNFLPEVSREKQDSKRDPVPLNQYVDFDSDNSSLFSNLEIEAAQKLIQK